MGIFKKNPPPLSEAKSMKKYMVSAGIPKKAIVLEEDSMDIVGNAYFTKKNILKPKKWKNIILITSDFHMRRTKIIFDFILGKDYKIKYVKAPSKINILKLINKFKLESKFIKFIREWVDLTRKGDDEYITKWLFTNHPAYSKKSKYTTEDILSSIGVKN